MIRINSVDTEIWLGNITNIGE